MRDINRECRGMPWPKAGTSDYHAQLGLYDEARVIKELVVAKVLHNPIPLGVCIKKIEIGSPYLSLVVGPNKCQGQQPRRHEVIEI